MVHNKMPLPKLTCHTCGRELDATYENFVYHRGRLTHRCRECQRAGVQRSRAKKMAEWAAIKARGNLPEITAYLEKNWRWNAIPPTDLKEYLPERYTELRTKQKQRNQANREFKREEAQLAQQVEVLHPAEPWRRGDRLRPEQIPGRIIEIRRAIEQELAIQPTHRDKALLHRLRGKLFYWEHYEKERERDRVRRADGKNARYRQRKKDAGA